MRRFLWVALALLSSGCTLLIGGGGGISKADMDKPDVSLVCGYVDMSDAPTRMDYFKVRQVLPKTKKPYWGFGVDDGSFCHLALPPGSYQLDEFGGITGLHLGRIILFGGTPYSYQFPGQGSGFRVEKPGLYFLGSFKYKKAGSFFNRKFDIAPVKTPTEQEVFQKIQDRVQGTKWEPAVAKLISGKGE